MTISISTVVAGVREAAALYEEVTEWWDAIKSVRSLARGNPPQQTSFQLGWNGDEVKKLGEVALQKLVEATALGILAEAQKNIVENDQVDTGFLLNSGYIVVQGGRSTYNVPGNADAQHQAAPEVTLPSNASAAVGFSAIYAVYQEIHQSFLFKAAQSSKIRKFAKKG